MFRRPSDASAMTDFYNVLLLCFAALVLLAVGYVVAEWLDW